MTNKYSKTYYAIIENAKIRTLTGYKERHHILPKALGGDNTKENLVDLTAKEHYVCHHLLPKFVEGREKYRMIYAWKLMAFSKSKGQERYIPSIQYEYFRKEWNAASSAIMKGKLLGEKNPQFGKIPWNKGMKFGPSGLPAWNSGKKCPNISESCKGKIPWNKGLTKDDPRVAKYSGEFSGVKKGRTSPTKGKIYPEGSSLRQPKSEET